MVRLRWALSQRQQIIWSFTVWLGFDILPSVTFGDLHLGYMA
jgi:hypothetical protein